MKIRLLRIPPHHQLRPFVVTLFELRAEGAYRAERVLPREGVSLLFNLGEAVHLHERDAPFHWPATLVAGLQTQPFTSMPGRRVHTMGVTLRPETCFALVGTGLDGLLNGFADGALLVKEADGMLNRLGAAASFTARCDILLEWLARRLVLDDNGKLVLTAARLLRHGTASGAVERASVQLGRSPRHLHRLFIERVGISPSRYVQLTRFTRALPLIGTRGTLTDVAARAGYFDHAHFCRDFRTFAGMTPDEYRQAGALVPGLLFSR